MNKQVEEILKKPNFLEEYIVKTSGDYTVYVCGSILEGFGNEKSDVDVYVLLDELPSELGEEGRIRKNKDNVIHNILFDNYRLDIEYWTIEKLSKLQNVINQFELDGDTIKLSEDEIDFIHRIKYAIPVINKDLFKLLEQKIDFDKFDKALLVKQINLYQSSVEDVEGCLESEDLYTAIMTSRLALDRSIDSLLCSKGETNPRVKWRLRKLMRAFGENSNIFKEYLSLQEIPEIHKTAVEEYVDRVLTLCSELIITAQQEMR
ncbi:nucleotidyltransferase domain-containing protein [Bacillus thuringiensis]|uniref:nucleotidyltransferase domain-containing protein n=1 Tax=Bacillus thuringiensis TaxID=1428 RepID=UPI000BFC1D71|nr:nucleotidyltransferase domain-containing protein [Bacillus thuringiensis]PGO54963.1 hypothetical protein CN986_15735 [Bacillus thuringiensis]